MRVFIIWKPVLIHYFYTGPQKWKLLAGRNWDLQYFFIIKFNLKYLNKLVRSSLNGMQLHYNDRKL